MKENKGHIFTETELKALEELGEVLRGIHNRLLSEGKIKRENGKTIFLEKNSYAVETSSALSVQILPCTIISKTYGIIALMFQDRNVFLSFVPRSSFSRRKPYLA